MVLSATGGAEVSDGPLALEDLDGVEGPALDAMLEKALCEVWGRGSPGWALVVTAGIHSQPHVWVVMGHMSSGSAEKRVRDV